MRRVARLIKAPKYGFDILQVGFDLATIENEQCIAVLQRRQPVGDHERRPARHQPVHRRHDRILGLYIH